MNGDYSTFIARMNERAKELDVPVQTGEPEMDFTTNSIIQPHYDMALIASEVYQKNSFGRLWIHWSTGSE